MEEVGDVKAGHDGRGPIAAVATIIETKRFTNRGACLDMKHVAYNHGPAAIDRVPLSSDAAIQRSSGDQAKPAIGDSNTASASKTGFFFSTFQMASRPSLPPEASCIPRR